MMSSIDQQMVQQLGLETEQLPWGQYLWSMLMELQTETVQSLSLCMYSVRPVLEARQGDAQLSVSGQAPLF